MDPVSLVIAALAAGASAGMTDAAKSAVKDTYVALRAAVREKFKDLPAGDVVLDEHARDPKTYQAPLTKQIDESGAAQDPRVIELAQALMALMNPEASREGKYLVEIRDVKGSQVGDRNTQFNTYN